ncbi:MAG: four helix bundle protein [Nitrospirales bacterium]|nr:four helix bundle protein [Nitrospirales bacterium]
MQRFEDLEAWQHARILVREIYRISNEPKFSKDVGLRDQIQRASVSTMANIAEGFERDGTREFIQFLSVAKSSAGEVRSHLYVASDQSYISEKDFDCLQSLTIKLSKMISGLMTYLRQANIKGNKFKKNLNLET